MINGKFFTGLPPCMIEREGTVRNRLESHFFWPNETNLESANEYRSKHRSNQQQQNIDRSSKPSATTSLVNVNDSQDSKQKFNREFTRSSIQFNDTKNEYQNITRARNILLNKGNRFQIAEKPTATRLELPDDAGNKDLSAARQKQLYESNIKFYDISQQKILDNSYATNSFNNLRKVNTSTACNEINNGHIQSNVNKDNSLQKLVRNFSTDDNCLQVMDEISKTDGLSKIDGLNCIEANDTSSNNFEKHKTNDNENNNYNDINDHMKDMKISSQTTKQTQYPSQKSFLSSTRSKRDASYPWLLSTKQRAKSNRNFLQKRRINFQYGNDYYPPVNQQNKRTQNSTDKKTRMYENKTINTIDCIDKFNEIPLNKIVINQQYPPAAILEQKSSASTSTPSAEVTASSAAAAATVAPKTKNRQHLYSSLRFHNGVVMGDDSVLESSQSEQIQQRRTLARNSATRRVSVGLPD